MFFVPLRPLSTSTIREMAQDSNIELHLNELSQGKHHFSFRLDDGFIKDLSVRYGVEKSEITGCGIEAEADLTLRESDYSLHIRAKGNVELICDRCLAPMDYPIDVADDIWPYESDEACSGTGQQGAADTLDLRWLTYELITINLPMVHCHPEGECMPDMQKLLQSHLCNTVEDYPE